MMQNFLFQIFEPKSLGSIEKQLTELEFQLMAWMVNNDLSLKGLLQTRIYMTDAANQWDLVQQSPLYVEALSQGAVSYIEQPLLSGAKVAIQVWFVHRGNVQKEGTPTCMKIRLNDLQLLFQSVRFKADEVEGMNSEEQTMLAFNRHIQELDALGMNLEEHCHRTWIYVRDIDRHYAGVVSGRNKVFAERGLTADTHYIASTGIGGYSDNREAAVAVDFLSIKGVGREAVKYLHALDYLNPTHEYGVAFERGTQVSLPQGALSFISGTASIDKHGECLHRGDVMTQTGRLFLNIDKLLADGGQSLSDIQFMLVYLRDISDYDNVNRYLRLRFPNTPYLIVEARVCRPEWLIEVECIAMRKDF